MILGASAHADRYAFLAANLLLTKGHEIVLIGSKQGEIKGNLIMPIGTYVSEIDTISLYVGPKNQTDLVKYLGQIKPRRIIFNPGTEHPELYASINKLGIKTEEACTLVLLQTGQF